MKSLSLNSIPLFDRAVKSFRISFGSTTTPFPMSNFVLLLYCNPVGKKFNSSPFGNLSIINGVNYIIKHSFKMITWLGKNTSIKSATIIVVHT